MPDPVLVHNATTGEKVPVYVGGDPQIELATEGDRGDALPGSAPAKEEPAPKEAPKEEPAPKEAPELPAAAKKEGEEAEPERDDKGRFVPKKRFDEVNERRRLAETKLAEIEAAAAKKTETPAPPAFDFEAKEQAYIELILDGKTKEAAALRTEIRAAEAANYERVATTRATETNRAMSVEQRIQEISSQYEAGVPAFNPENDAYSEELLEDVNSFYTGMLQSKRFDNAADAFQAAIDKALKVHGIEVPKAAVPPAAPVTPAAPVRTAAKRIDAIKNQPPNIALAGNGSAEHGDANPRVAELSEAEFARLPEATRRRLRGDAL